MQKKLLALGFAFSLLGTPVTPSFVSTSTLFAEPPVGSQRTALDDYVAKPDSTYEWKVEETVDNAGFKTAIIKLKSQTWRTEKDVDRPVWEHWLVVTVPPKVTSDRAFLMIGGGSHNSKKPTGPDAITGQIALATGGIVAELKNVPNQPLVFHGDGQPRVEDDLIGYAWSQFLESGDATWLPRLPMVKSAVRAMDCMTEYAASDAGGKNRISKFVVAGGSKRGWTTWMTGAADNRVEAIVPIVIDVVNVDPSLRHHAEVYGFWSEAIGNYYQHKIMQRFDHPRLKELYSIVDPYYYRGRLTMPKYIVNGSGDQFFVPDSSQFYYDQLQGEKLIRYVPNADHGLKNTDAVQSIASFYQLIASGKPRPEYGWTFDEDGTIRVTTKSKPSKVLMWQANNPKARDFRLQTIGPAFTSTPLSEVSPGVYVAPKAEAKPGWTATFVELTYDVGTSFPLVVTTAVRISPDDRPYKGVDLTKVGYEPELNAAKERTGK
ncbi:PhoPQ-activated pathogenicity-related family protein [Pirellulaceae bacterium SH501]